MPTPLDIARATQEEIQRYINEAVSEGHDVNEAVQAYFEENPVQVGVSEPEMRQAISQAVSGIDTGGSYDPILSNPVTHGADPTGVLDSGPAFKAAAEATGRCIVPPDGKFLIDSHTVMPPRSILKGTSWAHFGNRLTQLFRGPNIPDGEPMFSNVYWLEGLAFKGSSKTGIAVDLEGYCCRTIACTFNDFDVAQRCPGGTHDLFENNQYVGCNTAIQNSDTAGKQATCMSFIHNHFHYVKNAIDYGGIHLFNGRFRDNVFERVKGDAIKVRFMRECVFDNNWWEHRDGGEEALTLTIEQPQQCWGNQVWGSHTQAGWIDYFDRDPADLNGMAGHIGFVHERLQCGDNTDGGFVLDKGGLRGKVSAWGDAGRPFVVEAGRASGKGQSQTLLLQSRYRPELRGGRGVVIGGHKEDQPDGGLRYPISIQTGESSYHRIEVNRNGDEVKPNLAGRADLANGASAIIGIPAHAYVTQDGTAFGLEMFSDVTFGEGVVEFITAFQLDNPIIQVTTESGQPHMGIELIDSYVTSSRRQAKGFRIRFEGEVPNFWLQLMSLPAGKLL